jgi:hypothetical protein
MSTDNSKRIWVSIIGCGGCGGNLAATAANFLVPKNRKNGNTYIFRWYLYDMSLQVFGIADELVACNPENDLIVIKPTELDPGLGRVPISAEVVFKYMPELSNQTKKLLEIKTDYKSKTDTKDNFFDKPTPSLAEQTNGEIESNKETKITLAAESNGSGNHKWEEIKSIDAIMPSSINVYMSSLGGGTGGRSVSLMIPKIKSTQTVADVAICVITDEDNEELNNIYNISQVNKTADFTVLFENGVIAGKQSRDDEFINVKVAHVLDMIISTRLAPRQQDVRNLISFLRRSPTYTAQKK